MSHLAGRYRYREFFAPALSVKGLASSRPAPFLQSPIVSSGTLNVWQNELLSQQQPHRQD